MNISKVLKIAAFGFAVYRFVDYRRRGGSATEATVFVSAERVAARSAGIALSKVPAFTNLGVTGAFGVAALVGVPIALTFDYTFEHRKTIKDKIKSAGAKVKNGWKNLDEADKRKIKIAGGVVLAAGAAFVAGAVYENRVINAKLPAQFNEKFNQGMWFGGRDAVWKLSSNMPIDEYFVKNDGTYDWEPNTWQQPLGRLFKDSGYTGKGRSLDMSIGAGFQNMVENYKNEWSNASDEDRFLDQHIRGLVPEFEGKKFTIGTDQFSPSYGKVYPDTETGVERGWKEGMKPLLHDPNTGKPID